MPTQTTPTTLKSATSLQLQVLLSATNLFKLLHHYGYSMVAAFDGRGYLLEIY